MVEKPKKKNNPHHGSAVDHPFGSVLPFTAGQKKVVEKMLKGKDEEADRLVKEAVHGAVEEERKNFFSSGVVTAEQIKIIENLLDSKLTGKLEQFKTPINVSVFPKFRVLPTEVNIMNPEKYFNWKDAVWSSALGIIVGFVISKI